MAESRQKDQKFEGQTFRYSYTPGKKIAGYSPTDSDIKKLRSGESIKVQLNTKQGLFEATLKSTSKGSVGNLLVTLENNVGKMKGQKIQNKPPIKSTSLNRIFNNFKDRFLSITQQNNKKNQKQQNNTSKTSHTEVKQANQYELLEGAINSGDTKKIRDLAKTYKFDKNAVDSILARSSMPKQMAQAIQVMTKTTDNIKVAKIPKTNYKNKIERTKSSSVQLNF